MPFLGPGDVYLYRDAQVTSLYTGPEVSLPSYTLRQEKGVDLPVPPIDRSGVCARSVDVAYARACGTHREGTMLGLVSID